MYEYLDRRYALALYKVAEEKNKVEEYLNDLKEIVNIAKTDENMIQIIKHPEISTSKKKEIFINIFKDKIDNELLSFLLVLIEKDRIVHLEEKLNQFEQINLEKNNTILAKVKSVIPLLNEEKTKIIEKLENKYNKKIILKEELDKSLIGGVYIRVGNDVIDGTIKNKLNDIRKLMLKCE